VRDGDQVRVGANFRVLFAGNNHPAGLFRLFAQLDINEHKEQNLPEEGYKGAMVVFLLFNLLPTLPQVRLEPLV